MVSKSRSPAATGGTGLLALSNCGWRTGLKSCSTPARAAVVLLLGITAAAQAISIQLNGTSFRVAGWSAPRTAPPKGWPSVFAVYAGTGDVPPLLGDYGVENGVLTFRPRF